LEADINPSNSSEIPLAEYSDGVLLRRWKRGDERAADVLADRYLLRLVALVASRLNRRFRRQVDPEDVVQSALGSFFAAALQSRLQVSDSVSLWRLLATFARRKMARSIEKQMAIKRGGDLSRVMIEVAEASLAADDSVESVLLADELVDTISAELPAELRDVLDRSLAGFTQKEIAAALDIDERTVRRRVVRLREVFDPEQDSRAPNSNIDFTSQSLPRIDYREFVLGKLIGAGGFGKVYRASMQSDGSVVAVKFLRKGFWQHAEARESFLREIETASRVIHPGVIRYLGWGRSPHGGPYVLSEWIDGRSLDQCRSISAPQFVQYLQQICTALDATHRAGLVHGDLTPANILVTRDDSVVITDFGFSQSQHANGEVSEPTDRPESRLGGTLGFAAPEQVSAAFGRIGPRTDIYAVGGLAYWYLTGRAPHAAASHSQSIASTISTCDVNLSSLPTGSESITMIRRVAQLALRQSLAQRPGAIAEIEELVS
jgi:RNA polymerase sigma factor (sigma-70 family)